MTTSEAPATCISYRCANENIAYVVNFDLYSEFVALDNGFRRSYSYDLSHRSCGLCARHMPRNAAALPDRISKEYGRQFDVYVTKVAALELI